MNITTIETMLNAIKIPVNFTAKQNIATCLSWYTDSHRGLNFAKRACADDASLCESVIVNPQEIKSILKENNFSNNLRAQLELLAATGTVGAYISIENAQLNQAGKITSGDIKLTYVSAENIYPIKCRGDEIESVAFCAVNAGKIIITQINKNADEYTVKTYEEHKEKPVLISEYTTKIKPFAILKNAEVNNLKNMTGYGLPKLWQAIPVLKILNLCWRILFTDLEKGEKKVFINELLAEIKKGNSDLTAQEKDLFILLGEKLPSQETLIQEYNPEIRVQAIKDTLELCLSMLSLSFGYGTRRYTLQNTQIQTATEYIGSKQDQLQNLNKQREAVKTYVLSLCESIAGYVQEIYDISVTEDFIVDFDDSYIFDRETQLDKLRADAITFTEYPQFMIEYVKARYSLTQEQAEKFLASAQPSGYDFE